MDKLFFERLNRFKKKYPSNWQANLSEFLNRFRVEYERAKYKEYLSSGYAIADAQNKARNSWVAFLGKKLEEIVFLFLKDFCDSKGLSLVKGSELKNCKNNMILSDVRRKIEITFNKYSLLPDADIVIYKKSGSEIEVKAIISIKNSFRERYTETPYWKIKLKQNKVTENIKVFMITPDNDNEISFVKIRPRQPRIVMEYELDSIYLLKKEFDKSQKIKSIDDIFKDLESII